MDAKKIVILGTGGTIAGQSASAANIIDYTAAQLGVDQLVTAIPALARQGGLVCEQIAQIDSKNMSFAIWTALAARVQHHLAQADVQGVVITHGTDTLEETAYFLQVVLGPSKPVVMTCAMRPATAAVPDGPQNVLDAVTVARCPGAQGVLVVCAGIIHSAFDVQKIHTFKLNAFGSGDAGPIGFIGKNGLKLIRNWSEAPKVSVQSAIENIAALNRVEVWPKVDIVMSYAGVTGGLVDALVEQGVQGLVVAGTGNGTVHQVLEAALLKASGQGVQVVRATRCVDGPVLLRADDRFPASHGLSPVKARIALMLELIDIHA